MDNARLTRRAFLKASSACAASIALAAAMPAPAQAATLVNPYNGIVPMTFPMRRGVYWIFNNWHATRVGSIRPFNHQIRSWLRAHDGIDIFALKGTALYACTSGVVVDYPRSRYLYGNTLWIQNGEGYRFFYCHLDKVFARVGQSVDATTLIGTVGNTGNAATMSAHLHFELHYPTGKHYTCKYCAASKKMSALNPYHSLIAATPRVTNVAGAKRSQTHLE